MENRCSNSQPTKVIIDTDPGIDDALALMLALLSPQLEVVGITVTAGNAPVDLGCENAARVLSFLDRMDVPVYRGAEAPLRRSYVNALDTHGRDGLGESFLPLPEGFSVQEEDAVSFLARALRAGDTSVIAIGPLTNLARLIETDEEAFAAIPRLVSMGGCFKSHGNCSPVAEYNYWEDPDAARLVYRTAAERGRKIEMVGLDVTRQIVLTPSLLAWIQRLDPRTGSFVERITKFYFDFHWQWEHLIGCVINDPLAVAYFLEPDLCGGIDAFTDIETGGISLGQSVVDAMGFYRKTPNARVLTRVDVRRFWVLFLSRLLQRDPQELDLIGVLIPTENN